LPVIVDAENLVAGGIDYGSVELTSQPQDLQVVDNFLGVDANHDTMTGRPLPAAKDVTVSVLNGTGISGQAGTTGTALGALGLNVVGTGDAPVVGSVSETTVLYSAGHEAAAERVAHDLNGAVVMGVGNTANGADVTVVTGTDFSVAPPPSQTTTSGSAPSTSTANSNVLAPPTAPKQSLAPFDPRSCTASGGEGP